MNICSVDWDYFFPNMEFYDWGHNESDFVFFEALWEIRANDKNLKTREKATKELVPDETLLSNFWYKTFGDEEPSSLIITESHKDIIRVIETYDIDNATIWNFDAHHDIQYHEESNGNCGDWGAKFINDGIVSEKDFNIVYPKWRKEYPEEIPEKFNPNIYYEIPDFYELPSFDILFICRSSAWTPSWSDDKWMYFINHWKNYDVWDYKSVAEYVIKPRPFKHKTAEGK